MPKKSVDPTSPPPIAEPAPMIMITPADGGYQLNAYGLDSGQIVDALRLALLHIVATVNGAKVIQATFGRQTAIAVAPHHNGSTPGRVAEPVTRRRRRLQPDEIVLVDED